MTTVTIKGFVYQTGFGRNRLHFSHNGDMSTYGYVLIGPYEFEYEIPADFNHVAAEVAALEKRLEEINTEHAEHARQLKGQLANLLCIENKPSQTE